MKIRYNKNKRILSINKRNIYNNFIDYKKDLKSKSFLLTLPSIKSKSYLTINSSKKSTKNKWNKYFGNLSKKKRNYFKFLSEKKNINYTNLIETKLDVLVFNLQFATSLYEAQNFIKHGFITVNDNICKYPDALIKPGSLIKSNHLLTARSSLKRKYYPFFPIPAHLKLLSYNKGVLMYIPNKTYKIELYEKFN